MSRNLNKKERNAFMEAVFSDPVVVFKNNFSRHSYIFIFSYIFFNVFLALIAGASTIFGPTIFLPTDSIYPIELKQSTLKIQTFMEFCTIFMFNLTFTFRRVFLCCGVRSHVFNTMHHQMHNHLELLRPITLC